MNIVLPLKTKLHEALALAKAHVSTHRALIEKLKTATGEEKRLLRIEIAGTCTEWQRQMDKCTALHTMLVDYSTTGWERGAETSDR